MIFRFFHYIGLLIVKIYVHSYFERKYDKVLTFNIAYFPNFEISASLLLAPPSNRCRTLQFQNLISAGGANYRKCGCKGNIREFWKLFILAFLVEIKFGLILPHKPHLANNDSYLNLRWHLAMLP